MGYTALYRKFRPSEFEDVKGQEHIVTTLKNQIKADRVGHAYLFCGTRGTGKTTVAKIFAKAVNCESPVDGSPCGKCASCRNIAQGISTNVIEIDAASNNSVDNVREIREEVAYRPTEGKYKVYIIDEVHMLSTGAFNALLKTLEEPPEYVIFILATTEAAKIPVTILSRCQRYDFKRMSVDTIAARISELLNKEGIKADERGVRYIARMADGSMRDALSLLEECVSCYIDEELTYEKILNVLGTADVEQLQKVLDCVINRDVDGCIRALDGFVREGKEMTYFVSDFTWYLRNLLLIKNSKDLEDILDMSSENIAALKERSEHIDNNSIMRFIRIFSELTGSLRGITQKRIYVEMALIRMCRPQMEADMDSVLQRLKDIEDRIESGEFVMNMQTPQKEPVGMQEAPKPEVKEVKKAAPEDLVNICRSWRKIISLVDSPVIREFLSKAEIKYNGATGENKLYIVTGDETGFMLLKRDESREEILKAIEQATERAAEIEFVKKNEKNNSLTGIPLDKRVQEVINMPVEME
ncbi:MAG TPA: DNA polymerase III subunit gamma/tau [Candidatus Alectryocaccobium stercorigallinarum]|nr:DNA polymerase III subunit gamma/tau [Candidatus Alectryocaccobium stercorigallinarum]